MKYAYFDFIYNLGGAQKSTIDLINNLNSNGYEVLLFDAHGECDPFYQAVKDTSIKYSVIHKRENSVLGRQNKLRRLISILRYFPVYVYTSWLLLIKVNSEKVDFLWTNTFKGLFPLIFIKLILNKKIGFFIRGEGAYKHGSNFKRFVHKKFVDVFFVQSENIKSDSILYTKKETNTFILNNIIDFSNLNLSESFVFEKGYLNVVLPATVIPEKGIREAVLAINSLLKRHKVRLYVIGNTFENKVNTRNFYQEMKSYVEENNLQNFVFFLGFRDDILNLISKADLLLLPSYSEGMPRVVMEALYLETFVVATSVGAIPDLIGGSKVGYLIKPKSSEEIVKSIDKFISERSSIENELKIGKIFIEQKFNSINQLKLFKKFTDSL